jgi:predicted RND superfamily exporter protein
VGLAGGRGLRRDLCGEWIRLESCDSVRLDGLVEAQRLTNEQNIWKKEEMKLLSSISIRAPRRTLALVLSLAIAAAAFGTGTPDRLSNSETEFLSHGTASYRGAELLQTSLDEKPFPDVGVIYPEEDEGRVLEIVQRTVHLISESFRSRDEKSIAIVGSFERGFDPGPAAVRLAEEFRHSPNVAVGGTALAGQQFTEQVKHDLIKTELIAFPLLLLLALWIFRSVIAAVLPVFVGGLTFGVTLFGLGVINAVHPLSVFSLNLVTGAAVGLSIDYSLLLVSRFREELANGRRTPAAARATVHTAGRTVLISAATVATAFGSLLVFPLGFVRSVAIGGILVSVSAGLLSLIVLPAIFVLLGYKVNAIAPKRWQRAAERSARSDEQGSWYRLARFVMRRPALIAISAVVVLLTLGAPSFGARLTGFDASELPTHASARTFEERAKTEFTHSLFDEVVILAYGSREEITTGIERPLEALPGVQAIEGRNTKGNLWVFYVRTAYPPFSDETKQLVKRVRAIPYPHYVTGVTADYLDTAATLGAHLPVSLAILATSMLLLLFVATGSVILPIKAIVMNLFTLGAAFGLLIFIFQEGRFEGLLQYSSIGGLGLTQPLVLGAGTFGILTDYGVFLLTRIREGRDAGLSNREAIALGVERTGPIVTAAALLFCVAVGVLVTARTIFVKEVGLGVAAAVAIDATIVRAFLVPSLMVLLGRWNWWRPKWMRMGRRAARDHMGAGVLPVAVPGQPNGEVE